MANKMLIDASHEEETRVVVVRGNRVEEFDFESEHKKQLKGNIYLAKVTRVEPSLQAAFVEYGGNRHGFLAFSEIHPDYYQIPKADREALLAEEYARAAEEDSDDEPVEPAPKRRRSRSEAAGRSRSRKDSVSEDADTEAESAGPNDGNESDGNGGNGNEADGAPQATGAGTDGAQSTETRASGEPLDGKDGGTGEASEPRVTEVTTVVAAASVYATSETIETGSDASDQGAEVEARPTLEPSATDDAAPLEARRREESEEDDAKGDDRNDDDSDEDTEDRDEASDDDDSDDDDSDGDDNGDEDNGDDDESDDDDAGEGDDDRKRPRGRGRRRRGGGKGKPRGKRSDDSDDGDDDSDGEPEEIDEIGSEDAMEEVPVRKVRPRKQYKIQEVIKRRQILLVQVVKEERGNKGAALTTYLSLAGRYSVLMPNTAKGGGISRKITNQSDRKRLKDVVRELEVPRGMGIILRTAGANRTKAEVKRDYEYLMRLWENVRTLTLQSKAPTLVYEEGSLIKRSIRDLYNKDIDQVLVAGEHGYREAKDFMRMLMPSQAKAVQPYRDPTPIFARQGIEGQLDKMLQPHVTLKSGGYVIINQTEALVAIDVNSGRSTREMSIESTALQTNLEAAEEVARQLRLRDLAGLIVVDFIDMDEKRNNRAVEKKLKECLKDDRARIQVGKISHFGLLEMSRQRIRASVLESTMRPCPVCEGAGLIRSSSSLALHAVRHIEEYLQKNSNCDLKVRVPIETALYILNEKRHHIDELEQSYGLRIVIEADTTIGHQGLAIEQTGPATKPVARDVVNPVSVSAEALIDDELAQESLADLEGEDESEESPVEARGDKTAEQESGEDEGSGRRGKRRRRRKRRGDDNGDSGDNGDNDTASGDDGDSDDASDDQDDSDNGDDNGSDDNGGDENRGEDDDRSRRRRRRGRRGGRRHRDGDKTDETNGENDENGASRAPVAASVDAETRETAPNAASNAFDESGREQTGREREQPLAANDSAAPQPAAAESEAVLIAAEATPATADERFDDPVGTVIPSTFETSDGARTAEAAESVETTTTVETAGSSQAEAGLALAADTEAPAPTEPRAAEMVEAPAPADHGQEAPEASAGTETSDPVGETAGDPQALDTIEAEAPARPVLTEPVVTSDAGESEGAGEDKPRRTGWWARRGFL